jgi:hypothetical protein
MVARLSPVIESKVVAMVAAGWTNIATATALDVSLATVQRVKKRTNTKSGEVRDKAITEAKEQLHEALSSEYARGKAAMLIRDDFAMGEELRRKGAVLLEAIPETPESSKEMILYARALTSISTALKLSSDTLRQTLKLSSPYSDDTEDLPVLEVREMLAEDVVALRESQRLN